MKILRRIPRLLVLPLFVFTLPVEEGLAADPASGAVFKITDEVERPKDKVPPLGVNHYGGSGAVEWAANNFVQNSGNEPIFWKNMHMVTIAGPNWFEIDGPGTSWWDLWASGFLSGADLRIYRLVDKEGNSIVEEGAAPDMTRADHVVFVGKTKIIPEGAEGFPQGGWVANKYAEVHPNVNIQWGNLAATDNSGLKNGVTYWYSVVALGPTGAPSGLASEVSTTPQAGADDGPRILVLSREDKLPPVRPGENFSVEFQAVGGKSPLVWSAVDEQGNPAELPPGLTLDSQRGLITGLPMEEVGDGNPLRLMVTDAAGRSDIRTWLMNPVSNQAGGIDIPEPPTDLKAVAGDGSVTISWKASPSDGVTGYALRRSTAPLAEQGQRVYVVEGSPKIEPHDYVVLQRQFDPVEPFRMDFVNSRVRGIGHSMDRVGGVSGWNPGGKDVRLSIVKHPGTVPADMTEAGQSCLEVQTNQTGPVSINQTVFCGTAHGYESIWYGQLEPGKNYHLEVWLKQEGLQNEGTVVFDYGTPGGRVLENIESTFKVTGEWKKFTYNFTGPDRPTSPMHFGHRLSFTGPGKLWMDNFRISRVDRPEDAEKPFVPNATVLNELLTAAPKEGMKGVHRCWVLTRDLTMDNILSRHGNSKVNPDWITGVDGTGQMMLPQALEWCLQTGDSPATRVVPWIVIQHILHSEEDWLALVEYLAAPYDPAIDSPQSKPWAYRRTQQRGINTPWMDEFRELIIEFGNETWHNGEVSGDWLGFANRGQIWQGGKAYGIFSRYLIDNMQRSPYWKAQNLDSKIRFALGDGYVFNGEGLSYGEEAMKESPQATLLARANYVGPKWETGDVSSGVFDDDGVQETLLSFYASGENEHFAQKKATREAMAAEGHAYDMVAYEGGPSGYALPGSAAPEVVEVNEKYGKSLAMAVTALDTWLGSYQRGWTYQTFFAYGQGKFWNSHTPLWDEFRPTPGWLAMGLRNRFASGDMMRVEPVSVPMIDRLQMEIPLVGCYAFRDGNTWSVFVLNRKLGGMYRGVDQGSGNIPVTLQLPFKKAGKITLHKLTGDPRDGNRESMNIEIQSAEIPTTALAAADGTLSVNAATGATPEGLPAGSIFLYVFEDAAQ